MARPRACGTDHVRGTRVYHSHLLLQVLVLVSFFDATYQNLASSTTNINPQSLSFLHQFAKVLGDVRRLIVVNTRITRRLYHKSSCSTRRQGKAQNMLTRSPLLVPKKAQASSDQSIRDTIRESQPSRLLTTPTRGKQFGVTKKYMPPPYPQHIHKTKSPQAQNTKQ